MNVVVAAQALILVTPLYHWAYSNQIYSFQQGSWAVYILAVLVYDFFYYFFHRVSHKISVLWAVHSVHHQTHSLIPSLGLRSSLFDFAVIWLITIPMVLMGFGSEYLITALFAHGLYQLFLHNQWSISLGPLEWLFNSPNHHALHHATNKPYIDKNFGSILIVWDRLFGTFVSRTEAPKIGIHGMNFSHEPLLTNIAPFFGSLLPRYWQNNFFPAMSLVSVLVFAVVVGGIVFGYLSNVMMFVAVLTTLSLQSLVGIMRIKNN